MSIEAMKQALEALETYGAHTSTCDYCVLLPVDPPKRKPCSCGLTAKIESMRQAIEQAEKQKPMLIPDGFELVAVKGFDDLMYWLDRCDRKRHLENCPDLIEPYEAFDYIPIHIPINATQQPQREWVWLTYEEIRDAYDKQPMNGYGLARAIEAKLKEKNHEPN